MRYFFDIGDKYARSSTWKDFALVKACLFALGILCALFIPERLKKHFGIVASIVFLITYIPLIKKLFEIMKSDKH